MELARKKLNSNQKVSLHNRLKILEFIDYQESQGISLPRRIKYLQLAFRNRVSLHRLSYSYALIMDLQRVERVLFLGLPSKRNV